MEDLINLSNVSLYIVLGYSYALTRYINEIYFKTRTQNVEYLKKIMIDLQAQYGATVASMVLAIAFMIIITFDAIIWPKHLHSDLKHALNR